MGKALIIAEKPSVASDISKALGKFQKHDEYFENDDYVISSAVGHLLTIVPPEGVEAARGTLVRIGLVDLRISPNMPACPAPRSSFPKISTR